MTRLDEFIAQWDKTQVRVGGSRSIDKGAYSIVAQDAGFSVGMLGVLNGLFGTIEGGFRGGWGPIMFVFKDGDLHSVIRTPESKEVA